MKPKGHLDSQQIPNFVPKIAGKSRDPELMHKRYCLCPPGYLVQCHLCFIEGVFLPLEARKEFLAERNHYVPGGQT